MLSSGSGNFEEGGKKHEFQYKPPCSVAIFYDYLLQAGGGGHGRLSLPGFTTGVLL